MTRKDYDDDIPPLDPYEDTDNEPSGLTYQPIDSEGNRIVDDDDDWDETEDDLEAEFGTDTGSILDDLPSTTNLRERIARSTWWGALPGETTEFWDAKVVKGSGAAQVTHWLGGYRPVERGSGLPIYLARNMAFIKGLAAIVTTKMKSMSWAQLGSGGAARPLTGDIIINPAPVKLVAEGKLDELDAQTYTGGIAIHEAGHLEFTPIEWFKAAKALKKVRGFGKLHDQTLLGLAGVIEDGFIESSVIERHPGHQTYLAEGWTRGEPERVYTYAENAKRDWDGQEGRHAAIKLIEEINRRYSDPPADTLDVLDAAQQRFVKIGVAILSRTHNPRLTLDERMGLATSFIKLVMKGQVPPTERGEFGKEPAGQPGGDLNGDPNSTQRIPGNGESNGRTGQGLTRVEQNEAEEEEKVNREVFERPILGNGYKEIPVHVINGESTPGMYEQELTRHRALVLPLARAINLRNTTAELKVPKQIRGKLDDRRLAEVPILARAGTAMRVFKHTEILSAPDYGIELLIDRSSSMWSGHRDYHAKVTAVVFLAAVDVATKGTTGSIERHIHTHHSGGYSRNSTCIIERIIDDRRTDRDRIAQIYGTEANYDAAALWWALKHMEEVWPDRARLLLHVSDGMPNESGYGGPAVHQVIADLVTTARRHGTSVINLFIGESSGLDEAEMTTMYGGKNDGWLAVDSPDELPATFAKVLERQLRWQA